MAPTSAVQITSGIWTSMPTATSTARIIARWHAATVNKVWGPPSGGPVARAASWIEPNMWPQAEPRRCVRFLLDAPLAYGVGEAGSLGRTDLRRRRARQSRG